MHRYETIISHLMQAEGQLNEAIKVVRDNRGLGMTEDDVVPIAQIRNAISDHLSWFTRNVDNRI